MNQQASDGQALTPGTSLEEFVIEKVLGSGGFGITYLAKDTSLGRRVVIKENLPSQFAWRDHANGTVRPRHASSDDADDFAWSLNNFLREAETLASLDHPGIVRVLRKFVANGTAYFVMPFVEGMALDTLMATRPPGEGFTEERLIDLTARLLSALGYLHDRGIYHRDIKPGNILITQEGIPVLIDFGSARNRTTDRSMTMVESAGYTPFEQLQSRGNVGPWTDVYALGCTLYKVVAGQTPVRANDRILNDPLIPLSQMSELRGRFSIGYLQSIDIAMAVSETNRWQSCNDWLAYLTSGAADDSKSAVVAENNPPPIAAEPQIDNDETRLMPKASGQPTGQGARLVLGGPVPPATDVAGIPAIPAKKKTNRLIPVSCAMAGVLVLGAAGWFFLKNRSDGEASEVSPEATSVVQAFQKFAPTQIPDAQDWERLASEGDCLAQALLGESLVFGIFGQTKNADKGVEWLVKSKDGGHPLGRYLLAEYLMTNSSEEQLKEIREKVEVELRRAFSDGLEALAPKGGPSWQAAVGRAYEMGYGCSKNMQIAAQWAEVSAQNGHPCSNYFLAKFANEPKKAVLLYETSAIGGYALARLELAKIHANGPKEVKDLAKALKWAKLTASDGNQDGARMVGELYEAGAEGAPDMGAAFFWYQKAAEMGDPLSMGIAGRMLLTGVGTATDHQSAFKWLKQATEQGDVASFYNLGSMYEDGKGVAKDLAMAARLYQQGTDQDEPQAMYALAQMNQQGLGMPANLRIAADLYEKAAKHGHHGAEYRLGLMLLDKQSLISNPQRAAEMLAKSAKSEIPEALVAWGKCVEKGIGCNKDEAMAFAQYAAAAKQGHAESSFRMGLLLEEGRGTARDLHQAVIAYRVAADAGNPHAQVNLGLLYARGSGVSRDDREAVGWYRKAAEQGDVDGMVLLGMMTEFGHGTTRSPNEAAVWYKKAADLGDEEANKRLGSIKH